METFYWVLLLKKESYIRFYNSTNAVILVVTLVNYSFAFYSKKLGNVCAKAVKFGIQTQLYAALMGLIKK